MSKVSTTQDIEIRDTAAKVAAEDELPDVSGDKIVLNMGPSHPATHGVLRLRLEMDGEIITKAEPDVGYLHRGDEKIAENMTYNQFLPYTDRLDYLAPLANNVHYVLAVEKLLGITNDLPERCQYIRTICCELARVSAHLLGLGAFAMDTGALRFSCTPSPSAKRFIISSRRLLARGSPRATRAWAVYRVICPRIGQLN